jgi:anti-sigma factor RsiW
MNCQEVRPLLQLWTDGELDALKTMELERHVSGCAECAERQRGIQTLRRAFGAQELYEPAPRSLRMNIESALDEAAGGGSPLRIMRGRWLALAASLAIIAGTVATLTLRSPDAASPTARAVVDSHIRSTLADHLVDVVSSAQHTVKPWFQGKLDYSVEVHDLADHGFPLRGGRLDYVNGRAVAALVYLRGKHPINLFIWPQARGEGATSEDVSMQGYHLIAWTKNGMEYWAVSNLNEQELQEFVADVRNGK